MSTQSAKKRKNQPADFKRVKAKVGKRALKPANETNTETKFTTINVGHQNVVREGAVKGADQLSTGADNDIQELLSTRGRSLDDIVANLRHPASAVRISAARGLKDAVNRHHASPGVIRTHLAVLMPVCGKCCVDEDDEVRQLALEILREVITKVCSRDSNGDSDTRDGQGYLKPFMPLLMAHITSALNSLDKNTRLDGTSMVQMMNAIIPSLVAPFTSEFLPAYVIILSTRNQTRNKSSTIVEAPSYQVLQSLLALLKSCKPKRNLAKREASTAATDLVLFHGRRSINSLFIPGPPPRSTPSLPLSCLEELKSFVLSESESTNTRRNTVAEHNRIHLTPATTCDLLGKLRDCFAEATQPDPAKQDLQEVLLILESAHLFYKSSCHADSGCWRANKKHPFVKVWCQYVSLMMSQFPVVAGPFPASLVEKVNLEISTTILDAHLDQMNTETEHLDQVLAFLFGEVERCRPSPSRVVLNNSSNRTTTKSGDALFGALEGLLVISRDEKDVESSGKGIFRKLVKAIANNFFSKEILGSETEVKQALASSSTARKCVLLAKEIFSHMNWSTRCEDSKSFAAVLCQILQGLATFLGSWGCDFPFETDVVLTLLHSVARRLDITGGDLSSEESSLVDHIRTSLLPLLKHSKKRGSTFEKLTVELQNKTIGLIVILQAPTQEMLDGLGKLCARCWVRPSVDTVSPRIASDIVQSMHAVRRTIPMQAFLVFVTNSMGITQKPFGKVQPRADNLTAHDILRFATSVDLVSHILCQCGPIKVLPLMQPLLQEWLCVDQDSVLTGDKLLTAWASISILASCLSSNDECEVLVRDVAPKLDKPILTALCRILTHLPSSQGSGTKVVSTKEENNLKAFLEPFILLFQHEDKLFRSCFAEISSVIKDLPVSNQARLLPALTYMSKDVRLSAVLRGSTELVKYAKAMEQALTSSSLGRYAGVLRASMEVHCGEGETT